MDYTDIKGWIDVNKTLLDLYKSARDVLPKSKQRDEIDEKIRAAEDIMRRSDAMPNLRRTWATSSVNASSRPASCSGASKRKPTSARTRPVGERSYPPQSEE
jgi:hypothetical protein